jgi:endonuclease/exonuclease/phosphatase family metal-dependent hydrolase
VDKMRIVSWNCKAIPPYDREGFVENKAKYIEKYNADIYIIQECTKYDIEKLKDFKKNSIWYGDNVDSKYGIGVFSDLYEIELLHNHNSEFRYIVPYKVFDKNNEFILFAVWTKDKDKNNKKLEYTEQMWRAINFDGYKNYLSGSVILIGDFNSNNYWDKEYFTKKLHSHKDIINKLKEYNIESVYHKYYNCENSNEKEPTLLWQMDVNKKYHIDYCFASNNFKIKNVKIGDLKEWEETKYSDHCPLIIEFE